MKIRARLDNVPFHELTPQVQSNILKAHRSMQAAMIQLRAARKLERETGDGHYAGAYFLLKAAIRDIEDIALYSPSSFAVHVEALKLGFRFEQLAERIHRAMQN